MIKIRALNQTSKEKKQASTSKKDVEEQNAASEEYSHALKLLINDKKTEALGVFEELLKTKLVYHLKSVSNKESFQTLKTLKFSCLKNIGNIQNSINNYESALENSLEAINIDDSDVRLWCRIGDSATKITRTDLACIAYKQGLQKNFYFWPCLDQLISTLFVIPDYLNCLLYISIALERDPFYVKGLILQNQILETIPSIQSSFEIHKKSKEELGFNSRIQELVAANKCDYTAKLKKDFIEKLKLENPNKTLVTVPLKNALVKNSWLELGHNLIQIYNHFVDHNLNFKNLIEVITSDSSNATDSLSPKNVITPDFDSKNETNPLQNENQEAMDCNDDINNSKSNIDSESEKNKKGKKRRRSSLNFLMQWAWCDDTTKRSSRVRASGRKDHSKNYMLLEDNLKQLFPPSLLHRNAKSNVDKKIENDDTVDSNVITLDSNASTTSKLDLEKDSDHDSKNSDTKTSTKIIEEYFKTERELNDVKNFVQDHSKKSDLIIIMTRFLEFLSEKSDVKWPEDLIKVYIQLYLFRKNHITHPSQIYDVDSDKSNSEFKITLLFYEFYTDQVLNPQSSELLSQIQVDVDAEDLGFLIYDATSENLNNFENKCYLLRTLWMRANIFLHQGEEELSIKLLEQAHSLMQEWKVDIDLPSIELINCKFNSIISEKSIEEILNFIRRKKNLNKIKSLYKSKKYEELSKILMEIFNFSEKVNQFNIFNESSLNRVEYMMMLLDSLWQAEEYEDCFTWAEVSLNGSWHDYLNLLQSGSNEDKKKKLIQSVLYSLEKLYDCIAEIGTFIVKYLSESRLSRLLQNLVQVVGHQLDMLDNDHNIVIESILPWIIFHHIFLYEEDKQRANALSDIKCKSHNSVNSESEEDEEDIPASIKILSKAHEFLGHYGLCCMNDGKLLKFMMSLIVPKLNFPLYFSVKQKFKILLEQSIYCLYGYSLKLTNLKMKPKYLDDHVKAHSGLTWEASQLLFEIYKPVNLPTFDSKKVDTINSETFTLFKKITDYVPQDSNPSKLMNEMNSYLIGNTKKIPSVKKPLPPQISSLYYLIADYYFKGISNQWENSIKYYSLDLCLHHSEFNSWVGLAMSTSTLMETWLNNFEPNITEEKYLDRAKIAQKSYQHAIDLAPSHLTVCTEFGNFLYTVHSFCSRLLKQETDSLSMEKFATLENKKEEMLDHANTCFINSYTMYSSNHIMEEFVDERWLYQYMLGKISEKKNEDPPVCLKHYLEAAKLLFENNAEYPKKINHKNPPNLSVEALEVYYRVHTSILKFLEHNEDKVLKKSMIFDLKHTLEKFLRSPFSLQDAESLKSNNKIEKIEPVSSPLIQVKSHDFLFNNDLKRPSDDQIASEIQKKQKLSEASNTVSVIKTNVNGEVIEPTAASNKPAEDEDSSSSSDSSDSSGGTSTETSEGKKVTSEQKLKSIEDAKRKLIEYCIGGLEKCVTRFPEHYKSIYRLAQFFFRSKHFKNVQKSRQLLLGVYQCQFHKGHSIQGLFSDRKTSNVFNGIWRIPGHDIDRPGSFAYHMSRCITLLLDVLNELGDSKMLTELCIQLQKTPDSDKKYLKDTERKQLSHQALTMCLQCFRNKVKKFEDPKINAQDRAGQLISIILEIYHTYQNIKNIPEFEASHLRNFKKLLESTYLQYTGTPIAAGNVFEMAKEFCRQTLRAYKNAENSNLEVGKSNVVENKISGVDAIAFMKKYEPPNTMTSKKYQEDFLGTTKLSQPMNNYPGLSNQQFMKNLGINNDFFSNPNSLLINNLSKNFDIRPANVQSNFGKKTPVTSTSNQSNMVYSQPNTYAGFQNNTSTNHSSVIKVKNSESLYGRRTPDTSIKPVDNKSVPKNQFDVSITPVTQNLPKKKPEVPSMSKSQAYANKNAQITEAANILAATQLSLLKPSFTDQELLSLIQNQLNATNNLSLLKNNAHMNQSVMSQTNLPNPASGMFNNPFLWPNSYQGSMSNKRYSAPDFPVGSEKKRKKTTNVPMNNYNNQLYGKPGAGTYSDPNFMKMKEMTSSKAVRPHSVPMKPEKPKMSNEVISADRSANNSGTSMLSQLIQHPHLEIIPQTSNVNSTVIRKNNDKVEPYVTPKSRKEFGDSVSIEKIPQIQAEAVPLSTNQTPSENKPQSDSVEIITLDD